MNKTSVNESLKKENGLCSFSYLGHIIYI